MFQRESRYQTNWKMKLCFSGNGSLKTKKKLFFSRERKQEKEGGDGKKIINKKIKEITRFFVLFPRNDSRKSSLEK